MPPISIAVSRKPPSELYLKEAVRIASELSQEESFSGQFDYSIQIGCCRGVDLG
jgi:hypothetical protein